MRTLLIITFAILFAGCDFRKDENMIPTLSLDESMSLTTSKKIRDFLLNNKQNIIFLEFNSDYHHGGYYESKDYVWVYLVKENIGLTKCDGSPLNKSQEEIAELCMDFANSQHNPYAPKNFESIFLQEMGFCIEGFGPESPQSYGLMNLYITNKESVSIINESEGGWSLSGYFSVDSENDDGYECKNIILTCVPPVEIAKLKILK